MTCQLSASNKRFGILVFDVKVDRYTGRVPILGAIAQLVERFHGMEEVRGSIPLSSTPKPLICNGFEIPIRARDLRGYLIGYLMTAFLGTPARM